eukprot:Sdes_comp15358_c0_seq1m4232
MDDINFIPQNFYIHPFPSSQPMDVPSHIDTLTDPCILSSTHSSLTDDYSSSHNSAISENILFGSYPQFNYFDHNANSFVASQRGEASTLLAHISCSPDDGTDSHILAGKKPSDANMDTISVSGRTHRPSEGDSSEMYDNDTIWLARKEARLLRNRNAAREARAKKKEYIQSLEKNVIFYTNSNAQLQSRIAELEKNHKDMSLELKTLQ